MAMGILGQLVTSSTADAKHVYTVPVGKVAVINIFITQSVSPYGHVLVNNARCLTVITDGSTAAPNGEIKGIIADAGTTVYFEGCTGIVTGYEEDV